MIHLRQAQSLNYYTAFSPTMIVAIIQARMKSTRLPGKVLMDIEGKPMLQRVIERVKESKLIDEIIVAIPYENYNQLVQLIMKCKVLRYAGSSNNVLDRFYQAVPPEATTIVRITSDCPLIDPEVIDKTIQYFLDNDIDYIYNLPPYPDGLDTEVFSYRALEKSWLEATSDYDKEHVTTYIRNHPEIFRIGKLNYERDLSHFKWSVDTEKDLEFVRQTYQKLGDEFHLQDILNLVEEK